MTPSTGSPGKVFRIGDTVQYFPGGPARTIVRFVRTKNGEECAVVRHPTGPTWESVEPLWLLRRGQVVSDG